jgi:hypothetical protein
MDVGMLFSGASRRLRYLAWDTDAEPSTGCDSLSIEDLLLLCEGIF